MEEFIQVTNSLESNMDYRLVEIILNLDTSIKGLHLKYSV